MANPIISNFAMRVTRIVAGSGVTLSPPSGTGEVTVSASGGGGNGGGTPTTIFGGVGAQGATGSVTVSGTTATLSNGAVLNAIGNAAETAGQVFGPFSPSGEVFYLLLASGSWNPASSFVDNSTNFVIPFQAPIPAGNLYLYASSNVAYMAASIRVG